MVNLEVIEHHDRKGEVWRSLTYVLYSCFQDTGVNNQSFTLSSRGSAIDIGYLEV